MEGHAVRRTVILGAVMVVAAAVLAACGDDGGTVAVTLQEFAVATDPGTASAGEITFEATNEGPDDAHEFVVFRTDLGPTELPTVEDGSVDEEGEGVELIDEIEEFEPGQTESITLDLEAGNYVFICNLVEEEGGELESHYQEGMRTSFTVE